LVDKEHKRKGLVGFSGKSEIAKLEGIKKESEKLTISIKLEETVSKIEQLPK